MAETSIPGTVGQPITAPAANGEESLPEALRTPTKPVTVGFTLIMTLANVALWLSMNPVSTLLLPGQVKALDVHGNTLAELTRQNNDLALILTVGTTISIFSNAIGGALCDRTTSRFGRRRPWLLVCALLTAGSLVLLANGASIAIFALGWGLYQLFANGMLAALVAVVPDQVPERQRATVSAFVGLSNPLALVLGSILVTFVVAGVATGYYTLVAILVIVMTVFVLVLPDKPLPKGYLPPFNLRSFLAGFWLSPKKYPDFGWVWITRFLVILGYSSIIGNFLFFFISDGIRYEQLFPGHSANEGVTLIQIVAVAFLLISSVVGGVLSDRFQRRKLFVIISTVLISLALLLMASYTLWPRSLLWPFLLVVGAILGFGFGSYLAVDIALLTQVLPSAHDRGKDMGVFNIANALPQAISPALTAFVLSHSNNNYSIAFVGAAVIVLLGAILVQPIKSVR